MINQWFKFYGGEYLSDPKMLSLTAGERSCWLTLLCYASQNMGTIKYLSENQLMIQAGINPQSEEWKNTSGVLDKFRRMEMIQIDDTMMTLVNWNKRQDSYLTGYERTKKYRKNNSDKIKARNIVQKAILSGKLVKGVCEICGDTDTEAHHEDYSKPLDIKWLCKKHHEDCHHDDVMMTLEENRREEKRIEKKRERVVLPHASISYLSGIPVEDMSEFLKRFNVTEQEVKSKAEDLKLYCERKNKKYSNYKSFLINALKRDFKERDNATVEGGKYKNL